MMMVAVVRNRVTHQDAPRVSGDCEGDTALEIHGKQEVHKASGRYCLSV